MSLTKISSHLRGQWLLNQALKDHTWLAVGGPCTLFYPADQEDLRFFLKNYQGSYHILGSGSNILVQDEGLPGVVIKLSKTFRHITVLPGNRLEAEVGVPDRFLAQFCQQEGLSGLEFLYTIPGNIGGALAMNAGCYGSEISDVLEAAQVMDPEGNMHTFNTRELHYTYRQCGLPKNWIFLKAIFKVRPQDPIEILNTMQSFALKRKETQPLQVKTGGSTFRNLENQGAWKLIDAVGGRGLTRGQAKFSEKHCNFLINMGQAKAQDLWELGQEVRRRVWIHKNILLTWEILRWGIFQDTLECIETPCNNFH